MNEATSAVAPSDPLVPVLAVVLVCAVIALVLLWRRSSENVLHARLRERELSVAQTGGVAAADNIVHGADEPLPAWMQQIAQQGEQLAGTQQDRAGMHKLLAQAGWRRHEAVGLFTAIKYATGLVLCVLVLWLLVSPASRFGMTGLAAGLFSLFAGTTLVETIVKVRAAQRREVMTRSMPDALDLMVICAEAGLPFPRILKTVSRELALSAPVMADELAYTSAELQLLPDRTAALRHLAERTQVPVIESMVGSLVQAERYGTPLAQALRTIAEESRTRLILELEEKAGKLPAQLSIPLMTLILPPVVAIVATPALMRVIRSLMQ